MKAIEQYFPMVLFIILYKVVQTKRGTFEFVDELFNCAHLHENYFPFVLVRENRGSVNRLTVVLYKVVLTFN